MDGSGVYRAGFIAVKLADLSKSPVLKFER
jgi:hypothetical protein